MITHLQRCQKQWNVKITKTKGENKMENKRNEISFEVIEHVGVIAKYQNG